MSPERRQLTKNIKARAFVHFWHIFYPSLTFNLLSIYLSYQKRPRSLTQFSLSLLLHPSPTLPISTPPSFNGTRFLNNKSQSAFKLIPCFPVKDSFADCRDKRGH